MQKHPPPKCICCPGPVFWAPYWGWGLGNQRTRPREPVRQKEHVPKRGYTYITCMGVPNTSPSKQLSMLADTAQHHTAPAHLLSSGLWGLGSQRLLFQLTLQGSTWVRGTCSEAPGRGCHGLPSCLPHTSNFSKAGAGFRSLLNNPRKLVWGHQATASSVHLPAHLTQYSCRGGQIV
jgi:hypothetical protein